MRGGLGRHGGGRGRDLFVESWRMSVELLLLFLAYDGRGAMWDGGGPVADVKLSRRRRKRKERGCRSNRLFRLIWGIIEQYQ